MRPRGGMAGALLLAAAGTTAMAGLGPAAEVGICPAAATFDGGEARSNEVSDANRPEQWLREKTEDKVVILPRAKRLVTFHLSCQNEASTCF